MEYEKKRGVKDDCKGFSLNHLRRWNEVEKTEKNKFEGKRGENQELSYGHMLQMTSRVSDDCVV